MMLFARLDEDMTKSRRLTLSVRLATLPLARLDEDDDQVETIVRFVYDKIAHAANFGLKPVSND